MTSFVEAVDGVELDAVAQVACALDCERVIATMTIPTRPSNSALELTAFGGEALVGL